jgi:hypothetical protein
MKAFGLFIEKKHNFFFLNNPITKNQKPKSKQNVIFRASPILNIFSRKFLGLVLGCVGLIDAKGIGVAQPIWS